MTVYVSRHATTGELPRDQGAGVRPVVWPDPADPPLLTYGWRQLFERQVRDGGRR
ncbi:multiple cyclophane-containing RiPP AmcA [Micromonospora sp. WMMD1082]|uniref:multiple cyclophane-containing RiPP AmcA n=1 Tax=Micromonospora sp. WMMD1082 TaxID=3016104 RepID=UPI0032427256